ncbi:MAG: Gfo/Idh/MocA family oxidoreductase [Planctomycetota bacterium]
MDKPTRRDFLKTSASAAAVSALASVALPHVHAQGDNTIKLALVGCGGRGSGAAMNALSTQGGPIKLVAMADVFDARLQKSLESIQKAKPEQVDVPPERRFIGLDAYKKAIDCLGPGDIVALATPPVFRPLHFEYAVQKGVNAFIEKSFGVDGPALRRMFKNAELSEQKNLKVVAGLMCRHCVARQELFERIRRGEIGDVILLRAYRMHGPVGGVGKRPDDVTELLHQIRHWPAFTWTSGSFFVDWLIHNIDECCWMKNAWPASASGMAGCYYRRNPGQVLDHYSVEYTFPDGTKLFAQGRCMSGCQEHFASYAHGAKGSALISTGVHAGRVEIFRGQNMTKEESVWRWEKEKRPPNMYQLEWDTLVASVRENKPHNEARRAAEAGLTAVMGRMAAHSGTLVTREEALNSALDLTPGIDTWTADSPAPIQPGPDGNYPLPQPGVVKEY